MNSTPFPDYFLALAREKTNSLTLTESAMQLEAVLLGLYTTMPTLERDKLFQLLPTYCKPKLRRQFFVRTNYHHRQFSFAAYGRVVSAKLSNYSSQAQLAIYTKALLHASKSVMEPAEYQKILDLLPLSLRNQVL